MIEPTNDLIFDIGMYDGTDTLFYLESGFSVVSVEANPALADSAGAKFAPFIDSGKLKIVNAGISDQSGNVLHFSIPAHDLGSTSALPEKLSNRSIASSFSITTITVTDLFEQYGIPHFLKIDIEGFDRHCILPLTSGTRPSYLSFEAGPDFPELLDHLQSIGFRHFRAINQCNFISLQGQRSLGYRLRLKALHMLGFRDPTFVRLDGAFFRVEHGSGPLPWRLAEPWIPGEQLLSDWNRAADRGEISGWYDIHAVKTFTLKNRRK